MSIPQGIEGKASWIAVATSARVLGRPLVWSAMTAIFILMGYFWLQYYALPYSSDLAEESQTTLGTNPDAAPNNIGSAVKSHWNPAIYQAIKALEVMPITDNKDDSRADDYRRIIALEGKILPLLNKASDYMNTENNAIKSGELAAARNEISSLRETNATEQQLENLETPLKNQQQALANEAQALLQPPLNQETTESKFDPQIPAKQ